MRLVHSMLAAVVLALAVSACSSDTSSPPKQLTAPTFIAQGNPELLSQWGQVQVLGGSLVLGEAVTPYDLNTQLFTDYAHKLRTVWMPQGTSAKYVEDATFDFPVGTVITKTFYYPINAGGEDIEVLQDKSGIDLFAGGMLPLADVRLIETRVLVRREAGWDAIPYRWDEDQQVARLNRIGAIIPLEMVSDDQRTKPFNYIMPSVNECASCHATNSNTAAIWPIGPKARHINRDFAYRDGAKNQIEHWDKIGYLSDMPNPAAAPQNAAWQYNTASVDTVSVKDRARAYLDINCSHCHSPTGPADTSGLSLEPDASGAVLGKCKLPIAAGGGTGNRKWGINPGNPDESILVFRMESDEADEMMPEIGRSLVHDEGVALIKGWVAEMDGDCR